MSQSNLELCIDQLILPDLTPRQRARVVAAVEQELSRLWQEQGKPSGFVGETLAVATTHVEVAAGASPERMGVEVARSLYGQWGNKGQLARNGGGS